MKIQNCILAVIVVVGQIHCRKLGGEGDHHHYHHHEQGHAHHEEHGHDHHEELHNHHSNSDIHALESSIETVYADPEDQDFSANFVGQSSFQQSSFSPQNDFVPLFDKDFQQQSNNFQSLQSNSLSSFDSISNDVNNGLDSSQYDVVETDFTDSKSDEGLIEYNIIEDSQKSSFDLSSSVPTQLDDGTIKNCVEKEAFREELKKDPVLACVHKSVEKCHYTYTTQFVPVTEKVCDNNYEKHCSITYKKVAQNDTLLHCYKPLVRQCDNIDPSLPSNEECKEYHETSCTTRYVEKSPGKFLGDTACEKVPVKYCTTESCQMVPGPQECHDKVVLSVIDQPEEHCDLVPNKSCRHKTTLVPRLRPEPECVQVPQEICDIKYVNVRIEKVPYKTLWCVDEDQQVGNDAVPELPGEITDPITDGYQYEVPENPLTPPPRTTTSLPIVESEPEFIEPLPPQIVTTTTPFPVSPVSPVQPSPVNTVQLTPADLQAAITEAIRKSVEKSVAEAIELRKAAQNRQKLESSIRFAVSEAVRRAVVKSVEEQAASKKLQSSRDLEAAINQAIRVSVTRAVEKNIRSQVTMTPAMKTEMVSIEQQVQSAVVEAIRRAVTGAISQRAQVTQKVSAAPVVTQQIVPQRQPIPDTNVFQLRPSSESRAAAVEEAVKNSIRQAVAAAVLSRTQGLTTENRQNINTGIQTAVQTSISQQLDEAKSGESVDKIRQAVEAAVTKAVISAVTRQSQSSSTPTFASQSNILISKLRNAVKQAINNQLQQRLPQSS